MATLYFYHDPMCSWCWAYRTVSDQIFAALPDNVELVKIVGGLAPDSNEPMSENLRQKLSMVWQEIHDLLGTEFNFDFWTQCEPRRSTYPACRAVLAAGEQDRYDDMSDAIQRAYYLRAMNPSDADTLVQLATEINLDVDRFMSDMALEKTEDSLRQQIEFSRQSPIDGFPSLTMGVGGTLVSVQRDYQDPEPTLSHIEELLQ
jgi:putative protein-disulfide isomerase